MTEMEAITARAAQIGWLNAAATLCAAQTSTDAPLPRFSAGVRSRCVVAGILNLQECRLSGTAMVFSHSEQAKPEPPLFSGNKFSVESGQKQSSMLQEALKT
jgi:hypothetical protein